MRSIEGQVYYYHPFLTYFHKFKYLNHQTTLLQNTVQTPHQFQPILLPFISQTPIIQIYLVPSHQLIQTYPSWN